MTFEIAGEYNTATIHTNQPKGDCEEEALEQIKKIVNAEASEGKMDIHPNYPSKVWCSECGFEFNKHDPMAPNSYDDECRACDDRVDLDAHR